MRRAFGALVVALALPGPAFADLRAERVTTSWKALPTAPVLSGDDVVWAQESDGASGRYLTIWQSPGAGARLAIARWDASSAGGRHDVAALDGSADGVALWRTVAGRSAELHVGPSAGPLALLATMPRDERCRVSADTAEETVAITSVVVATIESVCTVLAERAGRHEVVVRIGEERRVLASVPAPAQALEGVRAAGPYVAWLHTRATGRSRREIHVVDAATGEPVQTVRGNRLPSGVIDDFDLAADGSVTFSLYRTNRPGRLWRARPGERARLLRSVPWGVHPDGLRVVGRRVVYVRGVGTRRELVVAHTRRRRVTRIARLRPFDLLRFDADDDQVAYAGLVRSGRGVRGGVFVARLP